MYAGLLLCSHHSDDLMSGGYLPVFYIVHTWNNPLHGKTGLRCKERNFRKKGSIKEVETSLT